MSKHDDFTVSLEQKEAFRIFRITFYKQLSTMRERLKDGIICAMKNERQMTKEYDLKLCSSMTLFEAADPATAVFARVLEKFYAGKRDAKTLDLLKV